MLAEMTLGLGDFAALAGVVALVGGAPSALVLAFLRGLREDQREFAADIRTLYADVKGVHKRLDALEIRKVEKLDWLREMASTRKKLDALMGQTAELGGKLDQEVGMAAVVGRLADNLKQLTEGRSA